MIRRICLSFFAFLLVTASPLVAQINDGDVRPDNVDLLPSERPLAAYALAAVFILAALGMGFMASKRTSNA